MEYNFDWDVQKAKSNISKHGVSFNQAAEVFLDKRQLTFMTRSTAIPGIAGLP